MAGRNYERLSIEKFGRQLITSGDLDPVYIALLKGLDDAKQLHRWLIAYWCFYHCGVASHMSERTGHDFWREMLVAARNEEPTPLGGRWPRGHERRHARGDQGINMVLHLRERYGDKPEDMVAELSKFSGQGVMFKDVAAKVKEHVLFGPWIAFKVGDMLERVLGCPVNFDQASVFMFKDPVKAAIMLWRQKTMNVTNLLELPNMDHIKPKDVHAVVDGSVEYLRKQFSDLQAPPLSDRVIDLQEVETVLCKWKSHVNGHYPLNNDIDEICEGLEGWGDTAKAFAAAMPEAV